MGSESKPVVSGEEKFAVVNRRGKRGGFAYGKDRIKQNDSGQWNDVSAGRGWLLLTGFKSGTGNRLFDWQVWDDLGRVYDGASEGAVS